MGAFKEEFRTRSLPEADNFEMRGLGVNMLVLFASMRFSKTAPMAQNPLSLPGKLRLAASGYSGAACGESLGTFG